MLKLHNITKKFEVDQKELTALHDVNLVVNEGELFCLVGPSGCGKSTLLRIIAGLEHQTSGQIIWEKSPVLSFVFQNYALFPYLNVFENIEFGLKMKGMNPHAR